MRTQLILTAAALVAAAATAERASAQVDTLGFYRADSSYTVLYTNGPEGSLRFHLGTSFVTLGREQIVAGDFDGQDGDELAFYSSREGRFYIASANAPGSLTTLDLGPAAIPPQPPLTGQPPNLQPVAGDWDGNGTTDLGIWFEGVDEGGGAIKKWITAAGETLEPGAPSGAHPFSAKAPGIGGLAMLYAPRTGTPLHKAELYLNGVTVDWPLPEGVQDPFKTRPVSGDWDNDGWDTLGVFDHGAEPPVVYLWNSWTPGSAFQTVKLTEDILKRLPPPEGTDSAVKLVAGNWNRTVIPQPDTGYPWNIVTPASVGFDPTPAQNFVYLERDALLVSIGNDLVFQDYQNGHDESISHNLHSVTKSFLSCLYAIALQKGVFPDTVPGDPQASLNAIRLDDYLPYNIPYDFVASMWNLVSMRAGYRWQTGGGGAPTAFRRSDDRVEWTVLDVQECQPNSCYKYSNGLPVVGCAMLERAHLVNKGFDKTVRTMADEWLFTPLGISASRWDHEPVTNVSNGTSVPIRMRPRDLLRFGYLYLNDGHIPGQTNPIVSSTWVSQSTAGQSPLNATYIDYAAGWRTGEYQTSKQVTYSYYVGVGVHGQGLFVVPDADLVCVILATDGDDVPTRDLFHEVLEGL